MNHINDNNVKIFEEAKKLFDNMFREMECYNKSPSEENNKKVSEACELWRQYTRNHADVLWPTKE